MSDTRSPATIARVRVQARALAAQLAAARSYLATTRPRVCCDCGHCFTLPSLTSSRRCYACGVERAPAVAWQERERV